tara:strand:- start:417 stop:812 length:396 start_codon:yes stop_codon:yes gene_type:complete
MDENSSRDKLIKAVKNAGVEVLPEPSPVKKKTRVLHRLDGAVAVLESETNEINKTDIVTLIREGQGYQVVAFSKKVLSDINKDSSGKLICSCPERKPCRHLMAVEVAVQNKVFIPGLIDVLYKMEDMEDPM